MPDSFDDASTESFTVPYQVVVAAVRGSWWDASQIYREWALAEAAWTRAGNLSTRTDIPAWLLRAPLWLRLSGNDPSSNSTFQLVDSVKEALGGDGSAITDIGLHWYSWNQEKFDSHYPIYTPKPGFRAAVDKIQTPHAGITARVVPYTRPHMGPEWASEFRAGHGHVQGPQRHALPRGVRIEGFLLRDGPGVSVYA